MATAGPTYIIEFAWDHRPVPPAEAIEHFPVKSCQVVADGEHRKLVTYWHSPAEAAAEETTFEVSLGAGPVIGRGVLTGIVEQPVPWWRRIQLHTWILAIAAFLGAVEALRSHYDFLFTAPRLTVRVGDGRPLQVRTGDFFDVPVEILNQSLVNERDVVLEGASLISGDKRIAVPVPDETFPAFRPGDSSKLRITAKAPDDERDYQLQVTVSSRAGLLRGPAKSRNPRTTTVEVWPRAAKMTLERTRTIPGGIEFVARLRAPVVLKRGIECTVETAGHPEVYRVSILSPGVHTVEKWMTEGEQGRETAGLRWLATDRPAFHKETFTLIALGIPKNWDAILSDLHPHCYEPRLPGREP